MIFLFSLFTIDHYIVAGFLLLTLVVGLLASKKVSTLKEYALGGKCYGTTVLMLTLLATVEGGNSTLGFTTNIFRDGIIMAVTMIIAVMIQYMFVGLFVAPRIRDKFDKNVITFGDIIEKMFSKNVKFTTGIVNFIYCIVTIAVQLLALGSVFQSMLSLDKNLGIIISGIIIVIYTTFGGIKSVTITDVLQFIILIVIIPLIALEATKHIGGVSELINQVPKEKFKIFDHSKIEFYLILFFIWMIPNVTISPPAIQRILMSKNRKQIRKLFCITAIFQLPFSFMVMLIGLAAIVLYPSISPDLVLPEIIKSLLSPVIKGLAISGILAVIMSTADSFLNAGSITFVHDVITPIRKIKKETKIIKYITLLLGTGAVLVAVNSTDIVNLAKLAAGIFSPVITIPFITGVLGLKSNTKSFFIAFFITLLSFIMMHAFLPATSKIMIPIYGILVNGVVYFMTTYITNRGFIIVKNDIAQNKMYDKKLNFSIKFFFQKMIRSLPKRRMIWQYSYKKIEKYGGSHELFAIFCLLNYKVPYFMWTYENPTYYNIMLYMRIIAGVLCVGLILKHVWPLRIKKYFPLYFHITLLYTLPFLTTTTFFLTHGGTDWLINIILAAFLLIALVDWISFLLINIFGFFFGFLFYKILILLKYADNDFSSIFTFEKVYLLIYVILFAMLICVIFFRKKEKVLLQKSKALRRYSKAFSHEISTNIIGSFMANIDHMYIDIEKMLERNKKEKNFYRLHEYYIKNLQEHINRTKNNIRLAQIKLNNLIENTDLRIEIEHLKEKNNISVSLNNIICYNPIILKYQKDNINMEDIKDFEYFGPQNKINQVIFNVVKNVYTHVSDTAKIKIYTKKNKRYNILCIRDNGFGISSDHIEDIFNYFYVVANQSNIGIGLAYSKIIMEKINGKIVCESKTGKNSYTIFNLYFPKVK